MVPLSPSVMEESPIVMEGGGTQEYIVTSSMNQPMPLPAVLPIRNRNRTFWPARLERSSCDDV